MPRGVYIRTKDMMTGKHMLGRHLSEATRMKLSNANKGKQKSKEFVEKIRLANLGKKHSDETKNKIGNYWRGRKLTPKQLENRVGSKNHNWKGGITADYKKIINQRWWKQLRQKVIAIYGYYCWYCNKSIGKGWQMQHLIPRRLSHDDTLKNLVPACRSCHAISDATYRRNEERNPDLYLTPYLKRTIFMSEPNLISRAYFLK